MNVILDILGEEEDTTDSAPKQLELPLYGAQHGTNMVVELEMPTCDKRLIVPTAFSAEDLATMQYCRLPDFDL